MTFRLIDREWGKEILDAQSADASDLRIICPFIKVGALARLLACRPSSIRVITRFNLDDFAEGVSDIAALRKLLEVNALVRGVRNLHAKLYLFGSSKAIVTSANLTKAAFDRNHEFGLITEDAGAIATCHTYFDDLWGRSGSDLSFGQIAQWDKTLTLHLASGGSRNRSRILRDHGKDAGIVQSSPIIQLPAIAEAPQAFVKFLGQGSNRAPLTLETIDEVERSGCHWTLSYPANKRPSGVQDGAVMFIARLTKDPADIRAFGRAIGLHHIPGRDDATPEDIKLRPFMATWPRYIRVHHAEFVAGTMTNGISLNELMNELGANSFYPTQRNAARGTGNTNPRSAYMQQAAVRLSNEGFSWLNERLQAAFDTCGKVPQVMLDKLDWPNMT